MSEATDSIRASLTDEWQSTKEIIEKVRMRGDRNCRASKVYRILQSDAKYGLVELKVVEEGPSGRRAMWRLPQ